MIVQPSIERRIQALLSRNPGLADDVSRQRRIAACLYQSAHPIRPVVLPAERVASKVAAGVPLLHGEDVSVDGPYVAELIGRLASVLRTSSDAADPAERIARAVREHRVHGEHVVSEALAGHSDHLAQIARHAEVAPELFATVAHLSARPLLKAYAERLGPALRGARWARGYCPLCGAWPGLAELRADVPLRHLRCFQCGSDWVAAELHCSFCDNADRDALGSFQIEGERRFRVDFCDRCRGYLKAGMAADPCPLEYLPFDDLASAELDVAAEEAGYARPPDPGFRLELLSEADDREYDGDF
jgi:FdhE protein